MVAIPSPSRISYNTVGYLVASARNSSGSDIVNQGFGFRVVSLPSLAAISELAESGLTMRLLILLTGVALRMKLPWQKETKARIRVQTN
jgi:hypothetical protein